jgi:hypothetical protein
MKIYHEGVMWTKVPAGRRKAGALFDRLIGINISKNKERVLVEPIYQAVLRFETQGGMTYITLAWDEPVAVIILMKRFPFVNIVKPQGYQLEKE